MILKIPGINKRDFLLTKSECQMLRYMLNDLHWSNCPKKQWMRQTMTISHKLDRLTMPEKEKK